MGSHRGDGKKKNRRNNNNNWIEEENEEAELAVDVYQTPTDIIVQTMVAGVKPEDLELSIARDMITIKSANAKKIRNYRRRKLFQQRALLGKIFPHHFAPKGSGTGRS